MYAKGVQKNGIESLQSVILDFIYRNQIITMLTGLCERYGKSYVRFG